MNLRTSLALIVLAAAVSACNSAQKEADKAMSAPPAEATTAARQAGSNNVVEVNFEKGSAVLTEGSRVSLRGMVEQARMSGKIDELKVLAWSDADYPNNSQNKLSKQDRELADKRASAIRDYVKSELGVDDVDTYNMAERPNAFEDMFNTSDARTKSAFESAGMTGAGGDSLTGKASHAIIMAMIED
jgi:outer membrane protein OmpA-like peptidoglycan-associated protein